MNRRYGIALFAFLIFFLFLTHLAYGDVQLPAELKGISFRESFFESGFKEVGSITNITGKGKVVILRREIREAFFADVGNPVYENDAVFTLKDCKCRITFKDKNVAMLAQDTNLDIDKVYADIGESRKDSVFRMAKGRAIFYVLKLFSYRKMSMKLNTPTSVIGVRGTKFGSEIEIFDNSRVERNGYMVASLSRHIAQSETVNSVTRVYVIEGEVDVTSLIDQSVKQLGINEILEAGPDGLGDIVFEPKRVKAFTEQVLPETDSAPPSQPEIEDPQMFQKQELEMRDTIEDIRGRESEPQIEVDDHHHGYE